MLLQVMIASRIRMPVPRNQADYEVVNVLDEVHNPGLRDAIKAYSQWPTIPVSRD